MMYTMFGSVCFCEVACCPDLPAPEQEANARISNPPYKNPYFFMCSFFWFGLISVVLFKLVHQNLFYRNGRPQHVFFQLERSCRKVRTKADRKSTRLNSSHVKIS